MRIHALQTGSVTLKESFLHARTGWRRRPALFMPGPWADPVPIHAWMIEHGDERILVDTGELANPKDTPFAKNHVGTGDELPAALEAAGFGLGDVTSAVVTHMHPDHYNGAGFLDVPVRVAEAEWELINSRGGRMLQRMTGAPLPASARFEPVALDGDVVGAFDTSRALTADGRVLLVPTPGHTKHHASVIAIDDDGRHVFLAGDTTDTAEQLRSRRADAIAPDPAVQIETIDRILEHATRHATVYLPSHDPDSAERLAGRETL